jgi:hypothetical protein
VQTLALATDVQTDTEPVQMFADEKNANIRSEHGSAGL